MSSTRVTESDVHDSDAEPEGSGRSKVLPLAVIALGVVLAIVAAVFFLMGDKKDEKSPTDTPPSQGVTAPEDGTLTLGSGSATTQVVQMEGICEVGESGTRQCRFPEQELPVVVSAPGELPLKAGKSEAFSISAVNEKDPSLPAPISLEGTALKFSDAPPGRYVVSVLGDREGEGVWRFILEVE